MTKKKRENPYIPLKNCKGIRKHKHSGQYQARKSIDGKLHTASFYTVTEARKWRRTFNGEKSQDEEFQFSTLREVMDEMTRTHISKKHPNTAVV